MKRIVGDLKEGKIIMEKLKELGLDEIMEKLKELGLDDEFGAIYDEEIVHKMEINSARRQKRRC